MRVVEYYVAKCGTGSRRCWRLYVWLEFLCQWSTSQFQLSTPISSLHRNGACITVSVWLVRLSLSVWLAKSSYSCSVSTKRYYVTCLFFCCWLIVPIASNVVLDLGSNSGRIWVPKSIQILLPPDLKVQSDTALVTTVLSFCADWCACHNL